MQFDNDQNTTQTINDLINIVSLLRDPTNGCPWYKIQTHDSLIPFVLEEAHEVAHAIREGNSNELKEELGDLLLQIVLHAQIAKEQKQFSISDIAQEITKKLIRRHPHIFQNKPARTPKEVNKIWEEIKNKEQSLELSSKPISDSLKLKIRSQTAINSALIISKKVTKAGFKWSNIESIWEKLYEELDEFKEAINSNNFNHTQEELGDILFTLINIACWYDISPEEGLAGTNKRFLDRFSLLEENLNGKIKNQSIQKLKTLWQKAKNHLNSKE